MTVTWPPSQHANTILYQLQYRPLGAKVWINASVMAGPATMLRVTGLTPGMMYEFRHTASNGPHWSEVSVPTQLRAPGPPLGIIPSAPTNLRAS